MSSDPLLTEMKKEHQKWSRSTVFYGTTNVAVRLFLILASALVAADKTILAIHPVFGTTVPLLAVAVTIVTAIDTWLKPRDKWRGFMEDRDDLADLLIRTQTTPPDADKLREEFGRLRRRHRNKHVY